MRFPAVRTPGYWAGFWLLSANDRNGDHVEIDVIEWYGGDPKGHHQSVHSWPRDRKAHRGLSNYTGMGAVQDGAWHSYGAQVRDGRVHIYMDRREVSRIAAPAAFDAAYYPLVTLAVLPKELATAVGPMKLEVEYIRAYWPL